MIPFRELPYQRPDYKALKESLIKLKAQMLRANDYQELKSRWLQIKDSVLGLNYLEVLAYLRFTCTDESAAYKPALEQRNAELAGLEELQSDCGRLILESRFLPEFQAEFGKQIVDILKSRLAPAQDGVSALTAEERGLMDRYMHLLSTNGRGREFNGQYYDILDRLIKVRSQTAALLGYPSYIDLAYRKNLRFDYTQDDLKRFREQINKLFTPVCDEIHRLPELRDVETVFSGKDELLTAIRRLFTQISRESGDYIGEMLDGGYIDLDRRAEKPAGYFACSMLPQVKMPFVIGSYTNNSYDAFNTIHELGHGFAFYTAAREQRLYDYHRASSSLNEIHSKTMEQLAYPFMRDFVGAKTDACLRYHLYRSIDNLPYRCAIDEFEHELYKDVGLTRVQRCELWAALAEKYLPWLTIDPAEVREGLYWPNQLHIFAFPFYYIEYDVAQISVFELYERSKSDYGAAWRDYSCLCRSGGSKGYLELLRGSNLSSPFEGDSIDRICRPVLKEFGDLLTR